MARKASRRVDDAPLYTVWRPDLDEKLEDGEEYGALDIASAAVVHARYKRYEHWPVVLCVRVSTTGEEYLVEVREEMVPSYVAGDPVPVKMPPAVHAIWGGDALCYDVRLAKPRSQWPKGQLALDVAEMRSNAELLDQVTCARCAKRARSVIAGLESIGAPRG